MTASTEEWSACAASSADQASRCLASSTDSFTPAVPPTDCTSASTSSPKAGILRPACSNSATGMEPSALAPTSTITASLLILTTRPLTISPRLTTGCSFSEASNICLKDSSSASSMETGSPADSGTTCSSTASSSAFCAASTAECSEESSTPASCTSAVAVISFNASAFCASTACKTSAVGSSVVCTLLVILVSLIIVPSRFLNS